MPKYQHMLELYYQPIQPIQPDAGCRILDKPSRLFWIRLKMTQTLKCYTGGAVGV